MGFCAAWCYFSATGPWLTCTLDEMKWRRFRYQVRNVQRENMLGRVIELVAYLIQIANII